MLRSVPMVHMQIQVPGREAAVQAALAALALHAILDFSLRIPALAMLAALVVGLASIARPAAPPAVAEFGPPRSVR